MLTVIASDHTLPKLPFQNSLKIDVKTTSLISELVLSGMENFIPNNISINKDNSKPWFMSRCAVALAQYNYYYHLYQKEWCNRMLSVLLTACNQHKIVLKNTKSRYAQASHSKFENKELSSCVFWKISNKILNRGILPVPSSINGPEVILSVSDKAKIFAMNVASNSMLDDKGHLLPDFIPLLKQTLQSLCLLRMFPELYNASTMNVMAFLIVT